MKIGSCLLIIMFLVFLLLPVNMSLVFHLQDVFHFPSPSLAGLIFCFLFLCADSHVYSLSTSAVSGPGSLLAGFATDFSP